jgi:hypothetical protein
MGTHYSHMTAADRMGTARPLAPGLSNKRIRSRLRAIYPYSLDRARIRAQAGCAVNLTPSARATFITVSNLGLAPGASAL